MIPSDNPTYHSIYTSRVKYLGPELFLVKLVELARVAGRELDQLNVEKRADFGVLSHIINTQ